MAERCSGVVLKYGKDWENFDGVAVWKAYRASGLKSSRRVSIVGSAAWGSLAFVFTSNSLDLKSPFVKTS